MRELLLPALPRGTLLPPVERAARLVSALPAIEATLAGETEEIAVLATLASLLFHTLPQTSWCGFYRRTAEQLLTVGPYQGPVGCLRIPFDRGVCGACARERRPFLVPDVHAFPDHIACDEATRSELVLPILAGGSLRAVLDLDSHHANAFSEEEAQILAELLDRIAPRVHWGFSFLS
ncbi:MAG: GAF domain-containing protein [Myxococcales bacterium]|nr:GAF domain-containing protein [Myxococcales bacterium]